MAQKITSTTIAIGVSFQREKTTWQQGEMRYVGIADDLSTSEPPPTFLGTITPIPTLGKRLVDSSAVFGVTCPDVKEVLYKAVDSPSEHPQSADPVEVLISVGPTGKSSSVAGDPWQLRDDFLRIPRSVDKLLAFLRESGSSLGCGQYLYPFRVSSSRLLPLDSSPLPQIVYPGDVWKLQDQYRAALNGSSEEWLRERAPIGLITHQAEFPFLVAKANDIKTAIEMTITIDKLNQVPFQKCERVDCYVPFEVRSGKDYCSQYCGHLVSVRNSRLEARKKKLVATHKKSKAGKRAKA
jgi:hypothetical protein